jgi:hypothetical protein
MKTLKVQNKIENLPWILSRGIQALVKRWRTCTEPNGDYVEKWQSCTEPICNIQAVKKFLRSSFDSPVLSFRQRIGLPSDLFPAGFTIKTL